MEKQRFFNTELEWQRSFYDLLYEKKGIRPDFRCNTDGRVSGTLIEFKLDEKVPPIAQLKGYLKAYNSTALPIPRYSLFVGLYHHVFVFIDNLNDDIIDEGSWKKEEGLFRFLDKNKEEDFLKGYIDDHSIVAYNDKFYSDPSCKKITNKEAFVEELRNPKILNIKSYTWNKTGKMERDLLDCLGSTELKKRLGAFFTPDQYVEISTEYLRNAIKRVPNDHDYIIVDRCAGTGNLFKFLTPDELSHCILNTYVYAEWLTLKGVYDDRVRAILPENKDSLDSDGLLSDGDALTEEFSKKLSNIIEKERKKADDKLVVIGIENPPFVDETGNFNKKGSAPKTDFIKEQMEENKISPICSREKAHRFIWSVFNKIKFDEYIVFAPIKYWKAENIVNSYYKFIDGHICNRKKFHASEAGISLFHWKKTNTKQLNNSITTTNDITNNTIKISKVKKRFKSIKIPNSVVKLAVLYINGLTIVPKGNALRNTIQNSNSRKINIGIDNIFHALPLWVANCYKPKDYTEKEVIMKSGDKGILYQSDKDFTNDCLFWACLTNQNICISNNQVRNGICLNQNTEVDKLINIDDRHIKLNEKWDEILDYIKKTDEYNKNYTYGLYQINQEINIKIETGRYDKKNVPKITEKYPVLDTMIKDFKDLLVAFYTEHIEPKLFEYELLK